MKIINASPSFGRSLTENEIQEFLSSTKLNIHIGTIDENGHPNVHPTWYFYDNSNNKIYIETSKSSKKTTSLRNDNRIYFCVDDPNIPYKGVKGKGVCKIHENISYNVPIAEKIMTKYLGSLEHPMAQTLLTYIKNGESVILEINPSYFSTWDYSAQT